MMTIASTWVRMMATVAIISGAPLQAFAATKCGDLNDVFAGFAMLEDIIPLAGQRQPLTRGVKGTGRTGRMGRAGGTRFD